MFSRSKFLNFTCVNNTLSDIKIAYTHQHADFSDARLREYELNLMVSGKVLMYLMCLPDGRVHAIREIRFQEVPDLKQIQQVLHQEPLLQEQFRQVIWISDETRFLMCPEEYLRYEEAEALYQEVRDSWQKPGILESDRPGGDLRCTLLHEPDSELRLMLGRHFPGIQFRHIITRTLFQANRIHQQYQPLVTALITGFDGYFTLNVLNRTGPVISQIFRADTADDYLYYLVWTCQQLNISPEHITLWLSGNFHTPTAVIDGLMPYFPGVKYLSGLTDSPWFSADSRVPVLHYIGLLPELS